MAHVATQSAHWSPRAAISGVLASIGGFLTSVALANSRFQKVQELQALSDEQLAERGMKREDIVQAVFSDAYWI